LRASDSGICIAFGTLYLLFWPVADADHKQGTNSPTVIPLPEWLTIPNLPLNLGTIGAILYSAFYILLEPVAGSINKIAIGVQIVAWIAQFIGHGVYEGRAPALLDNLVQAFVLAPFFVFMEALFHFGYRPELQKRVNDAVEEEIKKIKAEKAKQGNGTVKNGKTN
jgi:hypothetical protein